MSQNLLKTWQERNALSRLKSGDKDSFISAYDQYSGDLYRFIYFKVGRVEEAQDLVSATFLKAWNYIQTNSLKDSKTLRALLYKIARNAIIDHYRETSAVIESSLDDLPASFELKDEKIDLVAESEKQGDLELIKGKLELLKDEYREIIIMRFINDLSLEEIASATGKKKGNVRVILHRALAALKELVDNSK